MDQAKFVEHIFWKIWSDVGLANFIKKIQSKLAITSNNGRKSVMLILKVVATS